MKPFKFTAIVAGFSSLRRMVRSRLGEPVWTLDFDGEVRKARLKRCPDGTLLLSKISGWTIAMEDGGVDARSYVKKWWPREATPNEKLTA